MTLTADSDGFETLRSTAACAAASNIGWTPGRDLDAAQLAHVAWHCGVVEPAEIPGLLAKAPGPGTLLSLPCEDSHGPVRDALDERLPLPHPLDFEWRYDPRTRHELTTRVLECARPDGTIALLGAPTLSPALGHQADRLLLVDKNEPVVAALAIDVAPPTETIVADIGAWTPPSRWQAAVDVVVCDPPWYPRALHAFLLAAAHLTRPQGVVLLSVPDEAVRPGVAAELADLIAVADQLGLTVHHIERRALRYRTPFFEFQAQRAAGVKQVPYDWRVGTLWQLTKRSTNLPPPVASASSVTPPRIEVVVADTRIRIGTDPIGRGLLATVIDGDVLPTVSRRHVARTRANVWTSGNGIFSTDHPRELAAILHRLADGHRRPVSLSRSAETVSGDVGDAVGPAVSTICRLLDRERTALMTYRRQG